MKKKVTSADKEITVFSKEGKLHQIIIQEETEEDRKKNKTKQL